VEPNAVYMCNFCGLLCECASVQVCKCSQHLLNIGTNTLLGNKSEYRYKVYYVVTKSLALQHTKKIRHIKDVGLTYAHFY
jgi:hypothetical protein